MPAEQINAHEIGIVTGMSGDAYAESATGVRALEAGSPIYQGDELVTGDGGNIEVRFADDTLISQGGNSRIALDDYVYDPDGGDSSFLGDIAQGTFRTVTGKIAEQNPDRFKLGSPLATIGIRGTIILSEVGPSGESHGVEEIHAGKAMILQSRATGDIRQLFAGQMSDISGSGVLSPIRPLSTQELATFRKIAPANIRQEQEIQDQREEQQNDEQQNDEQDDDQQNDDQATDEQAQEEQSAEDQDAGEDGAQQEDGQNAQEGLPGDLAPGGGDPAGGEGADGGALHVDKGVIDPGDKALANQKNFDPDKIGQPPKPNDKADPKADVKEPDPQQNGDSGSDGDNPDNDEPDQTNTQTTPPQETPTDDPLGGDGTEAADSGTGDGDSGTDDGDSGTDDGPNVINGSGIIKGTTADDTITGSSTEDTIYGDQGNDTLSGGAGDDELFGQAGNVTLYGGSVEDVLNGGGGSYNYLDGGSGETHEVDFASFYGQKHGVTVDLSAKNGEGEVTVTTDDGQDVLVNIEGVIGTPHHDTLTGDDNDNRFLPGLNGEFDTADSTTHESIDGGIGSDWVQFEDLANNFFLEYSSDSSDAGTVSIFDSTSDSDHEPVSIVDLTSIENVKGSSGDDTLTKISNTTGTLQGGDGNDSILGGSGKDFLYGDAGNDSLTGGSGNDDLHGGDGNDSLTGGSGNDDLHGGNDNDYFTASSGNDRIWGDDGQDWFAMNGGTFHNFVDLSANTATGTDGETTVLYDIEHVLGSSANDEIHGDSEANSLSGEAGWDTIHGGDENDWLSGGEGNDNLYGDAGNDSISGGDGDDTIYGGDGDDHLKGGTGSNTIYGGIAGTAMGTDTLSYEGSEQVTIKIDDNSAKHIENGTTSTDTFHDISKFIGSDGNDSFTGALNEGDTFSGGKGNDSFTGKFGNNYFDGGEGTDSMSFAGHSFGVEVNITTSGGTVDHKDSDGLEAQQDHFTSVESFIGTGEDDIFNGSSNNETFNGGDGDDAVHAGGGSDILYASKGTNLLDGESGIDYVSYANATQGVTLTLNGSTGTQVSVGDFTDTIVNIEGVIGSNYQDVLTGDDGVNFFAPGINDSYSSAAQSSTADKIDGGGGSDWVQFDNLDSSYHIDADLSAGHVYIYQGSDVSEKNYVELTSIENLIGSDGDDTIIGSTIGANLMGGAGNDSISGGEGYDVIHGGDGDDNLAGGKGNNILDGGEGHDRVDYTASTSSVTFNLDATIANIVHSDGTDTVSNIEAFQGSDHADTFNGSSHGETFIGGLGNDIIHGGGGIDTLDYRDHSIAVTIDAEAGTAERGSETDSFDGIEHFIGSSEDDFFTGSDASETFEGSTGLDTIDGGGGIDFISFSGLDCGSGVDVNLGANAAGSGTYTTASGASNDFFKNIEGVIGTGYSDTITASSAMDSTIHGGHGNDTINLDGTYKSELIYNSASEGGDTITGFNSGKDYFNFSNSDLDSSAGFHDYDSSYTGNANAGTTDAYFVFDGCHQLWYDANGDATGGATMIADVSGDQVHADDLHFS